MSTTFKVLRARRSLYGRLSTCGRLSIGLGFFALASLAQGPTDPAGGGTALAALSAAKVPAGPTPRTSDGKPDLSGIWAPDRNFIYDISSALKKGETLPLQDWARKVTKNNMSKDDPEANCLPTGVPRQAPYPWRIVQSPTIIFFLLEGNIHSYRQIFLNMAKHSADPNPTWYGESIAKW